MIQPVVDAGGIYGILGIPVSVSIVLGALGTTFWLGVKTYKELTHGNVRTAMEPRRSADAEARLDRHELVAAVVHAHEKSFDGLKREMELTRQVFVDGIDKFVIINDRRHEEVMAAVRRVETNTMQRGGI